jgi:hypothetical protein
MPHLNCCSPSCDIVGGRRLNKMLISGSHKNICKVCDAKRLREKRETEAKEKNNKIEETPSNITKKKNKKRKFIHSYNLLSHSQRAVRRKLVYDYAQSVGCPIAALIPRPHPTQVLHLPKSTRVQVSTFLSGLNSFLLNDNVHVSMCVACGVDEISCENPLRSYYH